MKEKEKSRHSNKKNKERPNGRCHIWTPGDGLVCLTGLVLKERLGERAT